jgi:hypothetical protein
VTTAGLAGCSALADAKRFVVVTVLDASDESHTFTISISKDSETLAQQFVRSEREYIPDGRPSAQTELQVGRYPKNTELTVRIESDSGFETTEQLTLDCKPEYDANSVTVRVTGNGEISASVDGSANTCYSESDLVFSDKPTNTETQ